MIVRDWLDLNGYWDACVVWMKRLCEGGKAGALSHNGIFVFSFFRLTGGREQPTLASECSWPLGFCNGQEAVSTRKRGPKERTPGQGQ